MPLPQVSFGERLIFTYPESIRSQQNRNQLNQQLLGLMRDQFRKPARIDEFHLSTEQRDALNITDKSDVFSFTFDGPRHETFSFLANSAQKRELPSLEDLDLYNKNPENQVDGRFSLKHRFDGESGRLQLANGAEIAETIRSALDKPAG